MSRVLLIEDNREIAGMLFDYFEHLGMELDYADNGELGLKLAQTHTFDIILLDIMLPRLDGFSVCEQLRNAGNNTPILILSALDSRQDTLTGFGNGADDYLTKPFDLEILNARMHALMRRAQGKSQTHEQVYGQLRINLQTRQAYREDKLLILNPKTYAILVLLCQKAPEILTKDELVYQLWQGEEPSNEVLRSHIYQLRNQLDKPFSFPMLTTVPRVGFRLVSAPL